MFAVWKVHAWVLHHVGSVKTVHVQFLEFVAESRNIKHASRRHSQAGVNASTL